MSQPFWFGLGSRGERPALVEPGTGNTWTYRSLESAVAEAAQRLARPRALIFLAAGRDAGAIIAYLGALRAGHAVLLSSTHMDHPGTATLLERYRPEIILWKRGSSSWRSEQYEACEPIAGYEAMTRRVCEGSAPHPDLAVLLSTSASTGSPKLVRLSSRNLQSAADQVVQALNISDEDRAVTSLPVGYVFGLSVLNSHLQAGASLVVSDQPVVDAEFWETVARTRVTSVPGVTTTFEALRRVMPDIGMPHSIRKMTHSGEPMKEALLAWMQSVSPDIAIYLMYGQTEACGRITVLPPALLGANAKSVGRPVPGGIVAISESNEVVYQGPNVMLGYASAREDLLKGDEMQATLHTGDLGRLDEQGLLYLTGRASRLCKVLGQRINLDEIERSLSELGPVAAIASDGRVALFFEGSRPRARDRVAQLALGWRIPPQLFEMYELPHLARTSTGKIAYASLAEQVRQGRSS